MELERQVQVGIKEASLAIINDSTESKAVRRKHRLVYQQSKQRLQEIDACLNFIRQSHGASTRHSQTLHTPLQNSQMLMHTNSKHRTKKPRPPLDNLGTISENYFILNFKCLKVYNFVICEFSHVDFIHFILFLGRERIAKLEARGGLQDQGGISLSPLGPEHSYNAYPNEFQDLDIHQFMQPGSSNPNHNRTNYVAASPVDPRRSTSKFIEHDLNVNNNVYILPDQYRTRTYSQGAHSSLSASPRRQGFYQDVERPYRPVPNTFTEEERQYRQIQLQKQESHNPSYPEYRFLDNEAQRRVTQTQYYETEYSPRYEHSVEYQTYGKAQLRQHRKDLTAGVSGIERRHHSTLQPNVDSYLPPGHWMRLDDEIVWCPDDQPADRFGSLDRRKHNTMQYYPNADTHHRYHTVASGSKNVPLILPRHHPSQVRRNSK